MATSTVSRPVAVPRVALPPFCALVPWLFLAPAIVLFVVFKFVPMAQAVVMSFQDVRPYLGNVGVGGRNYTGLVQSSGFLSAVGNTVVLALGQTVGALVVGFVLALLVEGQARSLAFVRSAAFLPVVVPVAVVAELWRALYSPSPDGPFNTIIALFGAMPQAYLNDPGQSLLSVMAVGIWRDAPYDMMIIIAGLVGIDRSLYEAADIDGASRWRRILHVTLPGLRPVIAILLTLAAVRGLRVFTEVFALTNGGPNGTTEVLMTFIYKVGFEQNRLGLASAGAVVLFLATLVLTLGVRAVRR